MTQPAPRGFGSAVRRTLRRWLIRAVLIMLVFVLLGIMAVWWFDVPRICGCEPDAAHATPDVGQAVAPAYYEVVEEDLQQVAHWVARVVIPEGTKEQIVAACADAFMAYPSGQLPSSLYSGTMMPVTSRFSSGQHGMHSPEPTTRASAIRPIGLHEMVLEVADLDASTRFYRDVIGLTIVQRWEGEREAVWFDVGDTTALGLWTRETGGARAIANGRGGAHVHFALRIPQGSVDAVQAHLESVGVPIVERVDFGDGNRSLYVDDPDGNCLELMDAVVNWSNRPIPSRTQEQSG